MKFYYGLVDDLLQREEFATLVEKKINETGGILEDHVAAMLVLKDLGRAHRKISGLGGGASSVLFFGKVIGKSGPRAFRKESGDEGFVSEITVGDETGTARLLLWGDMARGIEEIDTGDVIEVLARLKSGEGSIPQLSVIALKESSSEINCPDSGMPAGNIVLQHFNASVITARPRVFLRNDGSDGEYIDLLAGNETGIFRIVCWAPDLCEGIGPGDNIVVENALLKSNRGIEEYHLNETSIICISDKEIEISFNDIYDVSAGGCYSVKGRVTMTGTPRNFTRRNGEESWVRTIKIADDSGELPVVMWDDLAVLHIVSDDYIAVYNATAKEGRSGGIELNTSGRCAIELLNDDHSSVVSIRGTVIRSPFGYTIDDGFRCYSLSTPMRNGLEVLIDGRMSRRIISPDNCSVFRISKESVLMRIDNFIERLLGEI